MPRKKSAAKKAKEAAPIEQEPIQDSLFGADDAEDEEAFTINAEYAQRYEHNKKREDLHRLQEKYKGANLDEDDSDASSSEEEDDEGDLNTPQIDAAILKMVARIRNKDPALYTSDVKFFEEAESEANAAITKKKRVKPTTIADVHRQTLLSGQANEDHDVNDEDDAPPQGPTHVEEQNELRRAFHGIGEEADSDDDVLVPRKRTAEETEEEEKQYRQFLEDQLRNGKDGDILTQLQSTKTEKPEDEEFLMNFVLNRGWIDKSASKTPSYTQLVDDEQDEDDFEDRAEEFETNFNFRFEKPGATDITTYPRDLPSVRRKDEKRKREREAKQEKVKSAKEVRMEELNRLKNLKKAEIEKKIKKIEEVTGRRMDFDELDLEGDFDPNTWDQKMIDRFDDSYYQEKDEGKPTWDDDIDIDDLHIDHESDEGPAAAEDNEDDQTQVKKEKKIKKASEKLTKKEERQRKQKIDEIVDAAVPEALGPGGRMFRYRQSEPETFGLTVEDILFADDAKLNEYVGLKKLAAFKPAEKVERDRKKYGARKRAKQFQKDLWSQSRWKDRASAFGDVDQEQDTGKKQKKHKSKKERA